MKTIIKNRVVSIILVLSLILVQLIGIGAAKVKADESNFSVQIVVESSTGVIVSDTSAKSNAYEALIDVLTRNKINYDFPVTQYGPQIKTIKDVTMADDWSTYWFYYGKRNGQYLNLDVINSVTLQNNDKLIVAFQDFGTKLVNKISYSTNTPNEPLTITLESTSDYNGASTINPVKNIKARIYNNNSKDNFIFDSVISDNKISLLTGLPAGTYTLELSDFKSNSSELPQIVADNFTFTISGSSGNNGGSGNTQTNSPYERDNTKISKDIQTNINEVSNYIKSNSSGDVWASLSLNKLGISTDLAFIKSSAADVQKNKGVKDYSNTDLEKLIMSLAASGYTPYNFMGYDLVAELYNRDINSFLINDAVYGILTMNYSNISGNYSITKQKLVDYILKNKLDYKQGDDEIVGWTLYGDKINADITGMVISALSSEYNSSIDVKTIVNSAVNSLSKLQNESGYIGDDFGYSSETLDFVILGLTSIGVDPEAAQFSKSKGDLVSALLSFKGSDGQFKHDLEGSNDYIATEEALRALISIKEYKEKGVYNYYSNTIDTAKLPQFTLSEKEMADLGVLPQTGYFVDNSILITTGILLLAVGVLALGKKKLTRER